MRITNKLFLSAAFLASLAITSMAASSMIEVSYFSKTMNNNRKMMVYLPDGYDNTTTYFPTFYLMHGGGQRYYTWANTNDGNAKAILDQAISSGKAKKMIVVMPDVPDFAPDLFTRELVNDVIPFVEKTYRAKTDKDSRALAGLSWGGLQVLDAGLYRYDLFGYLGVFSSGWFIGDNVYNVMNTYLAANGAKIEKSMRYLYFGQGGTGDIAYNNGMETMKVLRKHGITVHYWEHSGAHSFVCWRQDLRDFAPFLFQYGLPTSLEEEQEMMGIKAFPNPFLEDMVIQSEQPFNYRLFSMDGQEVESGQGDVRTSIGSTLDKGIYLLKLETGQVQKSIKIIKK